jgi:Fic family protein
MFNPKYHITNAILASITEAERLTAQLLQATIPAEILNHIRTQCQVALTHYSTNIEGNALTLEQVSGVLERRKTFGLIRDEKEVTNYFGVLAEIPTWVHTYHGQLNEPLALECHRKLVAGILAKSLCGKFRAEQNAIYEAGSGRLVYLPPEPQDVPSLIKDLFDWISTASVHPIIQAAIFHNQWVTIHPFMDGNGRSARILCLYLLDAGGYEWRQIVPIDRYYADDRARYYAMLQQGCPHNYYDGRDVADFSDWIAYFAEGIVVMLRGTINQIELYRTESVLMNNRQTRIFQLLKEAPFVTAADCARRFHISSRMASRDLTQLVEWGKLAAVGKARATRYILK